MREDHLEMTNYIEELSHLCETNSIIEQSLYEKYQVKKGLRDMNGDGVLVGLTNISTIRSKKVIDGRVVPCEGVLEYRGINIKEIVAGYLQDQRFGFEEVAYLLLFGTLPTKNQLEQFQTILAEKRTLPTNFVRDVVMKAPSKDIMNVLARSVLTLASYDSRTDDISLPNVLNQSLMLTSVFPMLAVYAYQAYNHYICGDSLYIHNPQKNLSTAENILQMLRPDKQYTDIEARVLDLALVLHMEHGGGNNSTFTTHVVSSSGTDTYSTIVAALGSLKGPKHGGANIKVTQMFADLKEHVTDYQDEDAISQYLQDILDKKAFDQKGLIYGMGHAIYTISDPRADLFKEFVERLAVEKGLDDDYQLYTMVEKLAPKVIAENRSMYKNISANVDFYSGFVYNMLGLPQELYTPMFAIARIVGWSAHRLEELINVNKIIRPAYDSIQENVAYTSLDNR